MLNRTSLLFFLVFFDHSFLYRESQRCT
jgi:hypothetical protein